LASPHYYEIRVAGTLPAEALLDFEQLNASVEPVETMVHGVIPDQAALYGLLTRLESLGAQVLEVRRLHDREPSWGEPAPWDEPAGYQAAGQDPDGPEPPGGEPSRGEPPGSG
jgi:hypothetical protein